MPQAEPVLALTPALWDPFAEAMKIKLPLYSAARPVRLRAGNV